MKVFIVENSSIIRERLTALLLDLPGIEVVGYAEDAWGAVESIHRKRPDVVILDIQMPGGSGFNVLRDIKQSELATTVIIFTNDAFPQYRQRFIDAGADFFLDKSGDFEELLKIFRDFELFERERRGLLIEMSELDGNLPAVTESAGEAKRPRRPETILLVEDEEIVREVARAMLEMEEYRVLEATGGNEAIELVRRYGSTIDLVMTDINMPQMGGHELIETLRPLLPEAKVIYMSGYLDDVVADGGVLDPGTYFLQKPFDPDMLLGKVREVLDAGAMKARA